MNRMSFVAIGTLALLSVRAEAVPIVLDDSTRCGAGNAANGILVSDVTGNVGGATDCWGTFDGNDPGPSGDGFDIGGMIFDFIAKENTPGALEGADIGLSVTPVPAQSGAWSFDASLFSADAFLIVLKAANSPGFGAWLFDGPDASSSAGNWAVAWERDLSHLSIYANGDGNGPGPGPDPVPEPSTLGLFGLGLALMGASRRRKKI